MGEKPEASMLHAQGRDRLPRRMEGRLWYVGGSHGPSHMDNMAGNALRLLYASGRHALNQPTNT